MKRKEGGPVKKFIGTVLILVVLLVAGGLVAIYSGRYDTSATRKDPRMVRWILETSRTRSVRHHAEGVRVPSLDKMDVGTGFRHFDEMCVVCHGAPGVEPSDIGQGLNPRPPDLAKGVKLWTPGELFWIVSRGFKMTGMPAFGSTHDEPTLWEIVAFIRRLPDMTPQEYAELRRHHGKGGGSDGGGHSHGDVKGKSPARESKETSDGGAKPSGGGKTRGHKPRVV